MESVLRGHHTSIERIRKAAYKILMSQEGCVDGHNIS